MYTVPMPFTKLNQRTREQLGEVIYLLGYLIHKANWETASLVTSQRAISTETGWSETTLQRWMQVLSATGEISTRRVSAGTLIQLNDYDDISRTRKVIKTAPKIKETRPVNRLQEGPQMVDHRSVHRPAEGPQVDHLPAKNGPAIGPNMDRHRSAGGVTNINRILSQNKSENEFQNDSPSLDDKKGASSPPQCSGERSTGNESGYPLRQQADRSNIKPRDIFDYTDLREVKIAEAREYLATLSDDERESVEQKALQDMSRDFRPFIRIFARLGDDGRFHPSSKTGEEMMLLRIAESRG